MPTILLQSGYGQLGPIRQRTGQERRPLWVTDYDEHERRVAEANEEQRAEKNQKMWDYMQEGRANTAIERKGSGAGWVWLGLGGLAFIGPVGWILIFLSVCVAVWWFGNKKRTSAPTRTPTEPPDNGWG